LVWSHTLELFFSFFRVVVRNFTLEVILHLFLALQDCVVTVSSTKFRQDMLSDSFVLRFGLREAQRRALLVDERALDRQRHALLNSCYETVFAAFVQLCRFLVEAPNTKVFQVEDLSCEIVCGTSGLVCRHAANIHVDIYLLIPNAN
jgi:hypothetical protein